MLYISHILARTIHFLSIKLKKDLLYSDDISKNVNEDFNNILLPSFNNKDITTIKSNITLLANQLSSDNLTDTKVVFYEMPLKKALANSFQIMKIRALIKQKFPDAHYISASHYKASCFRDGIHLTSKAGKDHLDYLVSSM